MLVKCKAYNPLVDASFDDAVDYIGYITGKYDDCAIRHNALVDIIVKDKAESK